MKNLLFTFLIYFSAFTLNAQQWNWAESLGRHRWNSYNFVRTNDAGDVFIAGGFEDSVRIGDTTLYHTNLHAGNYVARLDSQANLIWAQYITGNVYPYDLCLDG